MIDCGPGGPGLGRGNTRKSAPRLLRNRRDKWGFTFNNYEEKNGDQLALAFMKMGAKKFAFQEEIGKKDKTPHLQGCIFFETGNKIEFNTMKKIDKRIHWFRIDRPRKAIEYCLKSDTRKPNGQRWHHGINIEDYRDRIVKHITPEEMFKDMKLQMMEDMDDIIKEWKGSII